MINFNDIPNIKPELIKSLTEEKYHTPTAIQEDVISHTMMKKDILAQAPTGMGKTASFIIPSLNNLLPENKLQILVLAPTRELVKQIYEEYKKIGKYLPYLNMQTMYGGVKDRPMRNIPNVLICTPGRLLDNLERRIVNISDISTFVIDEVDTMLDMGFINDVKRILNYIKSAHQTMMYSATLSNEVQKIIPLFLHDHYFYKDPLSERKTNALISQYYIDKIPFHARFEAIYQIITQHNYQSCIIFTNSIRLAKNINYYLKKKDLTSSDIHSDLSQNVRERILRSFKAHEFRVLIGTDLLSRGIDISNVECVINYEFPRDSASYVHRIGRTGRNQQVGDAYTFINHHNEIKVLNDLSSNSIKEYTIPNFDPSSVTKPEAPVRSNHEHPHDEHHQGRHDFHDEHHQGRRDFSHDNSSPRPSRYQIGENQLRIFSNIGKKDNMEVDHFKDLLNSNCHISTIHDIYLSDTYSFITIDKGDLDKLNE